MKKILIIEILFALVLTFGLFGQAKADGVFSQDLYFGISKSSEVVKLQEFLTDQGIYSAPISGNFFSSTLRAVKSFQRQQGISPATGYFGKLTRIRANTIAGTEITVSNQQSITEVDTTSQLQLEALLKKVVLLQQQLATQNQIASHIRNLQGQIESQNQTLSQIQNNTQQTQQNTALANPCGATYPNCSDPSSNDYYLSRGMSVPNQSSQTITAPTANIRISNIYISQAGFGCGYYTAHFYGTDNYPACDVFRLAKDNKGYGTLSIGIFLDTDPSSKHFKIKELSLEFTGIDSSDIGIVSAYGHSGQVTGNLITFPDLTGTSAERIINAEIKINSSADLKTANFRIWNLKITDDTGIPVDISSFLPLNYAVKMAIDPR